MDRFFPPVEYRFSRAGEIKLANAEETRAWTELLSELEKAPMSESDIKKFLLERYETTEERIETLLRNLTYKKYLLSRRRS